MKHQQQADEVLFLAPGAGRSYRCGPMTAIFKADENETANGYSISEWWLEPHSEGPGAHSHDDNDEVFYGIAGVTSVLVGEQWVEVAQGSFLRIPAKTVHDFANRTDAPCAVLNFFIPGGFERNMPAIVQWFEEQSG
jgi:mannose-6-phosphate isomerase-like protein (cupin superfamily)